MLITCGLDVEGEGECTLSAFAALSHIDFRSIDFDFFTFLKGNATAYKEPNAHLSILQLAMTFDRT